MTDEELRKQWGMETGDLPTAFTVAELEGRSVEGVAGETRPHLERVLVRRRIDQLFRLAGLVVLFPLGFVALPTVGLLSWGLPSLITALGVVLVFACRQLLAVAATTRALNATRLPETASARAQWEMVAALGSLALMAVIGGVAAYRFAGPPDVGQLRGSRASPLTLSQCLDPTRASDPACARLQPADAGSSCAERWASISVDGPPQQVLAGLVSLGDECPGELVLPTSVLARNFLSEAIGGARTGCLAASRAEQWSDALEKCGAYARSACQGKPSAWLDNDEAFTTLLAVRRRLSATPVSDPPCVDATVVRVLQSLAAASSDAISLTSFQMKNGSGRISGTARSFDSVSEFMRGLNNVVWTAKGPGRIVERQRNGNFRVELRATDELLELTREDVSFHFSGGELLSTTAEGTAVTFVISLGDPEGR